jgi:hypothetical protein
MKRSPIALAISGLVFVGWLGYLGIQAWQYRTPPIIVSRSQLLASQYEVILLLADAGNGKPSVSTATVVELLSSVDKNGPAIGQTLDIVNIDSCVGFTGPGSYILPLAKLGKIYRVATPPLDPGASINLRPTVYPDTPSTRKQVLDYRAGKNQ